MADFLTRLPGASVQILYGNPLADWLLAALVAFAVWSGLSLLRRLMAARSQKYALDRQTVWVRLLFHLLTNTKQFAILALALYAAEQLVVLPPRVDHLLSNFVFILMMVQVGLWAGRSLRFYLTFKEEESGTDRMFAGSLNIINFVAGLIIWSLLILVALENAGVNITALLAGLGVGGVAVALALQNILGDLFASLSIALDKPFVVGEFLTIDAFNGTVERIGIKTTRLRSDTGEQIVLSNADILKSRVRNFGRMPEQRVLATLRVDYDTAPATLAGIPKVLENIVRERPHTRFERCHLKTIGESALQFELSYFTEDPRQNPMLDLQQAVNFRIIDEFRKLGIKFALPAQRIVLDGAARGQVALDRVARDG